MRHTEEDYARWHNNYHSQIDCLIFNHSELWIHTRSDLMNRWVANLQCYRGLAYRSKQKENVTSYTQTSVSLRFPLVLDHMTMPPTQ
jgi:hypothetical protein